MEIFSLLQQLLWISLSCSGGYYVSGQECWGIEPVIDPPSLVVKYGDPASATCRTQHNATMIRWDAPVGATSKENAQQLVWGVSSVTAWTLGRDVLCSVYYYTNHDNETMDEYTMAWNYGEDSECQIHLPIIIYKIPENVTLCLVNHTGPLLEGHEYLLECEVQSVAPVNNLSVIWFRGDTELKRSGYSQFRIEGDRSQNVTVRTNLSITASTEDNKASYSCAAQLDLNTAEPIPDARSKTIQLISGITLSPEHGMERGQEQDGEREHTQRGQDLEKAGNPTGIIIGVVVVSVLVVILAAAILIGTRLSNRDKPH
ncbi:intercellular adhesion molecule 1-like isoform X1 [Alosa pseudoharengus]|uniref:intercellular adhesion molecule 1-like isoform X1 n=1 Tax=Alosa pseudoharengus TaxID=34774 RepID=UPI003F8AEBEE